MEPRLFSIILQRIYAFPLMAPLSFLILKNPSLIFRQDFSWIGKTNAFFKYISMIRGLMEQLGEHSCSKKCECPLYNYLINKEA